MHKNDPKESSNFGEVVEAGGSKVQVLELESMEAGGRKVDIMWLSVQVPSLMSTLLPPASTTSPKFELSFGSFLCIVRLSLSAF